MKVSFDPYLRQFFVIYSNIKDELYSQIYYVCVWVRSLKRTKKLLYQIMGTFFKPAKKKKKNVRLNNISKFLRLNLIWIHFKIKEKRMYPYKFKNGLEKN